MHKCVDGLSYSVKQGGMDDGSQHSCNSSLVFWCDLLAEKADGLNTGHLSVSINSWRALLLCKFQNCCILSANWKAPADFCVQSSFICCHLLDVKKPQSCRVCFFHSARTHFTHWIWHRFYPGWPSWCNSCNLAIRTHSYSQLSISGPPNCMSLNCGGNWSTRNRENMQTPHRKDSSRLHHGSNSGPSCCETTVIPFWAKITRSFLIGFVTSAKCICVSQKKAPPKMCN